MDAGEGRMNPTQGPTSGQLHVYGDDPAVVGLIGAVIARLPEDVQSFVRERCFFLWLRTPGPGVLVGGFTVLRPALPGLPIVYLIVFRSENPGGIDASVVVRQVAYGWLGCNAAGLGKTISDDIEAAGLVRGWGFTGLGADVEADGA